MVKNVVLNSFQHLTKSRGYETLKYPESSSGQGDEIVIATQSLWGERGVRGDQNPRILWHVLQGSGGSGNPVSRKLLALELSQTEK